MASHKSAEKRARQTERRTAANTARRSRVRGSIKKVEEAIKNAGGVAIAGGFVSPDVLQELEQDLEAAQQGAGQEQAATKAAE